MTTLLTKNLDRLNQVKRRSRLIAILLQVVRGLFLSAAVAGAWAMIQPQDDWGQLTLALISFAITMSIGHTNASRTITSADLLVGLDMEYPNVTPSPYSLKEPSSRHAESLWQPILAEQIKKNKAYERQKLLALASSLVLPVCLMLLTLSHSRPTFKSVFTEVAQVVSILTRTATLEVLQGATKEEDQKPIALSRSKNIELELMPQNLISIELHGGYGEGKSAPILELRKLNADGKPNGEIYQSFQMQLVRSEDTGEQSAFYKIAFAVSEDVQGFVPSYSGESPLATIKIKKLPIPIVELKVMSELEDPWPDDRPLNLKITAEGKNPLHMIRLMITSGKRTSQELVNNIMTTDMYKVETDYQLVLETFVESDLAEVEIVAEAIDRAVPTPLIGKSIPLVLKTASAYGRYRNTLTTLRELKSLFDEAEAKQQSSVPEKAKDLAEKAIKQAENSPFFDGLDRVNIHKFKHDVDKLLADHSNEQLMQISTDLSEFLFEHEMLDDRERDRDFFVAARGYSRVLEQERKRRPVDAQLVAARLLGFLEDRYRRWKLRNDFLPPESRPQGSKAIIEQKPFTKAIDKINQLDQKAGEGENSEALSELSRLVVDYRSWIEALEAAEDKYREKQEQKRQEGLASARDELKELQKRQGEISQTLDQADKTPKQELEEKWPSTRMKQNTNTSSTRRLEGQLRTLSPTAGVRIKAAVEQMEETTNRGNAQDFALAESHSDLAGRLLRQADQAAKESQRSKQNRGRRRRITGDNYYGQSVIGGDVEIKREYAVDPKYREEILDEIRHSTTQDDNRGLLEDYLRQTLR